MDKPLLDEIIIKMEEKGFNIHGIILDLGNQRLLKQLGFYDKNYFCFPNPADPTLERRVRIFPDAPHMLKLARSHLFDQGFLITQLKGGESSKHEIENAQQEFPRPCDIYRTKYVDFLKSC